MLTLNDGRNELWQWDTGRTLSVDADCSQVHFSNKVFGRSIDVDVSDGTAIIPDILLQTDKDLNVWAFVGTAENGYTKISKTFKVNRRNKPADYVFTPPEQITLSELVERLDAIEESQDQDAIKNVVKDYLKQNPVEVPVKSVNGKTGAVELKASDVGAISQEDLQNATNEALTKAKESGAFDGPPGDDYVLTDADRQEIAEIAAGLVEVPDVNIPAGGGGGNKRLLIETLCEEEFSLQSVSYDVDSNGEPLASKQVIIQVTRYSNNASGTNVVVNDFECFTFGWAEDKSFALVLNVIDNSYLHCFNYLGESLKAHYIKYVPNGIDSINRITLKGAYGTVLAGGSIRIFGD